MYYALTIVVLLVANIASAFQAAQETKCPSVSVSCVHEDCYRQPFRFQAQTVGALPDNINYLWVVTEGQIVSGQGTPVIEVAAPNWRTITAIVKLVCATSASSPPLGCV